MPRLNCPECEAEFNWKKPLQPNKKIHCPECKHSFIPEDGDDEANEGSAPSKDKKQSNTKQPMQRKKKSKSPLGIALILVVGGGGLCLVAMACSGALYFVLGGKGPGGGGLFGNAPPVSKEQFDKLRTGMSRPEIEAIMGGEGDKCGRDEILRIPGASPGDAEGAYVAYRNGGSYILVGYRPSKKFREVCFWVQLLYLNGKTGDTAIFMGNDDGLDMLRTDYLRRLAKKEAIAKYLADTNWKKGPEARDLLLGTWADEKAKLKESHQYQFKADGTVVFTTSHGDFGGISRGTYQYLDDDKIKVEGARTDLGTGSREHKFFVGDDDLFLIEKSSDGTYNNDFGRKFRRVR